MSRDDGGPAFPQVFQRNANGDVVQESEPGMSLRDYFAGQALMGELASQNSGDSIGVWTLDMTPKLAKICYATADAMLAARKGEQ